LAVAQDSNRNGTTHGSWRYYNREYSDLYQSCWYSSFSEHYSIIVTLHVPSSNHQHFCATLHASSIRCDICDRCKTRGWLIILHI
uniref:Ovule protein n=1 Tax=Haemonchus placei TaxID=6290 RepID=A0A0N4W9C6_HAEPC